ncbi:MAG: hypothetical protein ACR2GZ_09920 [Solirubrobacteraceae bacterium]
MTPLSALRAHLAGAVVTLNYDGTLAPVVERPEDAVPAPGAVAALTALALKLGISRADGGDEADRDTAGPGRRRRPEPPPRGQGAEAS